MHFCIMYNAKLWTLPNKEIKSYIGKTKNNKGLKLSDNVQLVLMFWAMNLKLEILIQVGGKQYPLHYTPSQPNFGQNQQFFMERITGV